MEDFLFIIVLHLVFVSALALAGGQQRRSGKRWENTEWIPNFWKMNEWFCCRSKRTPQTDTLTSDQTSIKTFYIYTLIVKRRSDIYSLRINHHVILSAPRVRSEPGQRAWFSLCGISCRQTGDAVEFFESKQSSSG